MKVEDVRNVTVAGGGTQGSQIASQIAYKGYNVTVWVRSEESIARALPRFEMVRGQYLGRRGRLLPRPLRRARPHPRAD